MRFLNQDKLRELGYKVLVRLVLLRVYQMRLTDTAPCNLTGLTTMEESLWLNNGQLFTRVRSRAC